MNTKNEIYTLNRLYHEAKALLEKYGVVEETHELRVSFAIEEKFKKNPTLDVSVHYSHQSYGIGKSYYGSGITPNYALEGFEDDLKKATGTSKLESVGVEVLEEEEIKTE